MNSNKSKRLLFLGIFLFAFFVRFLHHQYLLDNPLYSHPRGGHVPYLIFAESIADGNLVPDESFVGVSSPGYPYLLAGIYSIAGVHNYFAVRLFSLLADSATCVILSYIALTSVGFGAALLTGIVAALTGPLVFYSAELMPIPFTLLFLFSAVALLTRPRSLPQTLLAGIFIGLSCTLRANLLLAVPLFALLPLLDGGKKKLIRATFVGAGAVLGILPVTLANYAASGEIILLTPGGGHNFYIGHNPHARAGYSLPQGLDGSIFASMKKLAEELEGRPMGIREVSPYYMKRALKHIRENPKKELELFKERSILLFNDGEATTYVNYYFHKELSPILRYLPSFGYLLPWALLGMITFFRKAPLALWIPIGTSAFTLLAFFNISRLRMPMLPSISFFAALGIIAFFNFLKKRELLKGVGIALALLLCTVWSLQQRFVRDTANEWNKAGTVLLESEKYPAAQKAFETAIKRNPADPNSYYNLALIAKRTGHPEVAEKYHAEAELRKRDLQSEAEAYRKSLKEAGSSE